MSINSHSNVSKILYTANASYFGLNPMNELKDGENGADAVQSPLKQTLIKNNRQEVQIIIETDKMTISFYYGSKLELKLDLLVYCGALTKQSSFAGNSREFETLDKAFLTNSNEPLNFVAVFRNLEQGSGLNCHSFEISNNTEAMQMVKVLKEAYYNLVQSERKLSPQVSRTVSRGQPMHSFNDLLHLYGYENADVSTLDTKSNLTEIITALNKTTSQQTKNNEISTKNSTSSQENNQIVSSIANDLLQTVSTKSESNKERIVSQIASDLISSLNEVDYSETTYNELLELSARASQWKSSISIDQIKVLMNKYLISKLELEKYEIFNKEELMNDMYSNLELNIGQEFIEIRKPNPNQIVYSQELSIRYLKPPTPEPPGDIISILLIQLIFFAY